MNSHSLYISINFAAGKMYSDPYFSTASSSSFFSICLGDSSMVFFLLEEKKKKSLISREDSRFAYLRQVHLARTHTTPFIIPIISFKVSDGRKTHELLLLFLSIGEALRHYSAENYLSTWA